MLLSDMVWGCSSVGRAPRSQRGGQRFDPAQLHHSHRLPGTLPNTQFWGISRPARVLCLPPVLPVPEPQSPRKLWEI